MRAHLRNLTIQRFSPGSVKSSNRRTKLWQSQKNSIVLVALFASGEFALPSFKPEKFTGILSAGINGKKSLCRASSSRIIQSRSDFHFESTGLYKDVLHLPMPLHFLMCRTL
jgi:hypothetical protein